MNEEQIKHIREQINNDAGIDQDPAGETATPTETKAGCLSWIIAIGMLVGIVYAAIRLAPWAYGYIKLAALWLYNFGLAMHPVDRLAVLVLCLYILGRPKCKHLKATTEKIRRK